MENKDQVQDAEFVQTGNVEQVEGKTLTNAPEVQTQPELTPEQRQKMENQQKLYKILQQGGLFLKFIHNDMERMKKDKLNRAQRRRFERGLSKGEFSRELIETYYERLQEIQAYIDSQLNPQPSVDGAEFYENLQKQGLSKEAAKEYKAPKA